MNPNNPNERPPMQEAKSKRDVTQVGRDYTNNSTNTNKNSFYLFISLFIVLALGGLAWALVLGVNNNGQNPQSEQQSQPNQLPTTTP